jgi:hypothetical protein
MHSETKLNSLDRDLPEGLVVDAAWLSQRGFSTSLRSQYVAAGRLEQPARRVYRRPRGTISWQQVVLSLQMMLGYPLMVGGRTALELHGYAHYLSNDVREVHLYGPKPPPTWLPTLPLKERFVYHSDRRLFGEDATPSKADTPASAAFATQKWGMWDWAMSLSDPARAMLELLDELPTHESFEQADKFMQGLTNLSPRRVQSLLAECHNVKVKRLFFFFADRHSHAWLKHLDRNAITMGAGKRMLVKGGKFDSRYQITVPEAFHGHP